MKKPPESEIESKNSKRNFIKNGTLHSSYRTSKVRFFIMNKIYIYLLLTLLVPKNIYSQKFEFSKYAGEFLQFSAGARAAGIGGAFAAIADDGFTSYWNPAGLTEINIDQLFLMHSSRFGGEVKYDFIGYASKAKKESGLGISLLRIGIDEIPDTRNALLDFGLDNIPDTDDEGEGNGQMDGDERIDAKKVLFFSNNDYVLFLSYAKKRSETLSIGGSAKIIKRKIGENDAWGIGFDLAMLKRYNKFRFGLILRDITTTLISWDTGENELITPSFRFGTAYTNYVDKLSLNITAIVEIISRLEGRSYSSLLNAGLYSMDIQYGVELCFLEKIYLRTGFDEIKRFSAGTGIQLPNLRIDYSFTSFNKFDQLGNLHRVSLLLEIDKNLLKK